jgi:LAO/AO transport system kinase
MDLTQAVLAGDRLALARLLTKVENDSLAGRSVLDALFPATGKAHVVGVTGSPGTGKSSLVNQLTRSFRRPNGERPAKTVAIVAVDPSSPFTGGALLGDRVRMRDLSGDRGVFIRSMASRGASGGLARSTAAVVNVLDAAGFELILVETVGAGQSEVDIARLAHTTIVVEAPGMGDEIQAIKAGILETADILVVNKADRSGAENTERALRLMLETGHPVHEPDHEPQTSPQETWLPPVLHCISTSGEGVESVLQAILDHRDYLQKSGVWRQREHDRLKTILSILVQEALVTRWRSRVGEDQIEEWVIRLCERSATPYEVVEALI